MVKVIVMAVPGSGKTTILKRLVELKPEVRLVNFGDIMFEVAKDNYGIASRDEMRSKIGYNDYRRLQLEAASRIGEMAGSVVIDTHAAVKTPYGYYPGVPSDVAICIKPQSIVFLEFRAEDVAARRAKDEASRVRSRDVETLDEIEEHQQVSMLFAVAAANHTSCYFSRMQFRYREAYPYQHVKDAAEKLKKHIELLESMQS